MSQALRVLNPTISKTRTCVIFINQIRQKIGVMYGNPETTPGGLALKFYSSARLEVRRGPAVKDGDEVIGTEVKVKVVKNKIAPPFRTAEFEVWHDRGINYESDLVNVADDAKVLTKSGSFFSFGDQRLGQGKENAKEFLRDNPAVAEQIRRRVLEQAGLLQVPAPPVTVNGAPAEETELDDASGEPAKAGGKKAKS
jgi:recombination protein RecA